jgi:hypothetical protein
MKQENLEKIQRKLELITRKWWFYLIFVLIQFIPPYASKGFNWSEIGLITGEILSNAIVYSYTTMFPIFKIIPIILVVSIIIFRNRVSRIFSIYAAFTYVLIAFLQSIAETDKYGFGILTLNLIMFLVVAVFWFWEAIVQKNDFTPQKRPLWKYWVIPFAIFAFWYPVNPNTFMPDFHPLYLFTNLAGLAFCLMTPVYLAILTLYHPKVNIATLRVTSIVGLIIGFYNMWVNFFISPETLWWNGVLHIPLLTISIYGLILSLKKRLVEEAKRD